MGKTYKKNDFENMNSSVSSLQSLSNSASTIQNNISDYVYNLITKSKLEGAATVTIGRRLNDYSDNMVNMVNDTNSFCIAASKVNTTIAGAFGDYSVLSDDNIDEIKKEIDKINTLIDNANSSLMRISFDEAETRSYWSYLISQYKDSLSEVEELYEDVKSRLDDVKSNDSISI